MPNFGNVGRELAKEINEDPEVEIETEDERERYHPALFSCLIVVYILGRDRLLLESEDSIRAMQCLARGFLVRKTQATQYARLRFAERYVPKIQAICRGAIARCHVSGIRRDIVDLTPWAVRLQTASRMVLKRRQWLAYLERIRASVKFVVKTQAQIRGVLQRRRFARLKAALQSSRVLFVKFQSSARAKVARQNVNEVSKTFAKVEISTSDRRAHV